MAAHAGKDFLDAGEYFTVDDVNAVAENQGTPIMEGDVVLFHTGWTDAKLQSDPETWVAAEPGQSEEVCTVPGPISVSSQSVLTLGGWM